MYLYIYIIVVRPVVMNECILGVKLVGQNNNLSSKDRNIKVDYVEL